jgi:hypothetical protein
MKDGGIGRSTLDRSPSGSDQSIDRPVGALRAGGKEVTGDPLGIGSVVSQEFGCTEVELGPTAIPETPIDGVLYQRMDETDCVPRGKDVGVR